MYTQSTGKTSGIVRYLRVLLVIGVILAAGAWQTAYGQSTAGPAAQTGAAVTDMCATATAVSSTFTFPGMTGATAATVDPRLVGVPSDVPASSLGIVASQNGKWLDVPSTLNSDGSLSFVAEPGVTYAIVKGKCGEPAPSRVLLPATGSAAAGMSANLFLLLAAAAVPLIFTGIGLARRTRKQD